MKQKFTLGKAVASECNHHYLKKEEDIPIMTKPEVVNQTLLMDPQKNSLIVRKRKKKFTEYLPECIHVGRYTFSFMNDFMTINLKRNDKIAFVENNAYVSICSHSFDEKADRL